MAFPKTCIVIPCYNESERLEFTTIFQYLKNHPQVKILFVNDGSTDNTSKLISDSIINQPQCSLLDFEKNQGKSEAVRHGLNWGWNHGFDWVGFWDADMATPLEEIEWLFSFSNLENQPYILGSRVARLGSNIERTMFRHYSGRIFATLISYGLGWKVHDSQCGAKLIHVSLKDLFETPFKTRWLFDVEILLRIKNKFGSTGIHLCQEVPIRKWRDVAGSKIGTFDFVKVPYQIWKVFNSYKK
jgi:glycosyltransferase involved in cell wall biosynthesis